MSGDRRGVRAAAPGVTVVLGALLALALSAILPAPTAAAPEGVRLEWRIEKGEALRYRYTSDQTASQRTEGGAPGAEPVTTRQKETIDYRLSAIERDGASGDTRVICRYEAIALELDQLALGRVRWDSRKKEDALRAVEPAIQPFARMLGLEWSFLLSRSGGVSEVRGHDKVRALALAGLEDSPFAKLALGGIFSDEAVRAAMERGLAIGPTGSAALEVGASWARVFEQPVPILGTLAFEGRSTLERIDAGMAHVRTEVRISLAKAADPEADPVAASVAVDLLEGRGESAARFSTEKGRLERSEGSVSMKLRSRLLPPVAPDAKPGGGGVSVMSEVTQRLTVELLPEPAESGGKGAKEAGK